MKHTCDTSEKNDTYVSHVMRKPAFCLHENTDADQLPGNLPADQHLGFHNTDSTIPLLLLSRFEISSLNGCMAQFVPDLVRNPEDRFSCDQAHLISDKFDNHHNFVC